MTAELKIRPEAVEWREIEGEIVALDVAASTYLAINAAGALMWPALVEGTNREELADSLAEHFDLDRSTAGKDVNAFVDQLAGRGLLEAES